VRDADDRDESASKLSEKYMQRIDAMAKPKK